MEGVRSEAIYVPTRIFLEARGQVFQPLASSPGVAATLAALTETSVTVFMLHRFAVPELSIEGHHPDTVREILTGLRKRGFTPLSLHELFLKLRDGEPVRRAVAFTIDDGYFDHARVGAPVFAELGFPVTIFVVSGFLDGKTWLWWDQLMHLFTHTRRNTLTAPGPQPGREISYALDSKEARRRYAVELSYLCQDASEPDRLACLADLTREADVELPAAPPPQFAPLPGTKPANWKRGASASLPTP